MSIKNEIQFNNYIKLPIFNFINFKRIIRFNLKKNEKKIKNFNKTS